MPGKAYSAISSSRLSNHVYQIKAFLLWLANGMEPVETMPKKTFSSCHQEEDVLCRPRVSFLSSSHKLCLRKEKKKEESRSFVLGPPAATVSSFPWWLPHVGVLGKEEKESWLTNCCTRITFRNYDVQFVGSTGPHWSGVSRFLSLAVISHSTYIQRAPL